LLLGDFCPSSGLEEASVYFLLVFPMIVLLLVTPTLFIVNVQLTIILKGGDGFFTIAIPQFNPNPKNPMSVDFWFTAGSKTKNPFI